MPVLRVMLAFLLAAGLVRSTNNLRATASRQRGLWHTNIAPRVRG